MKLSMLILAEWLAKYQPEADIKSNNRHLQNVRLFSENQKFSQSTVYLMPMPQDRIVCSNGNDILTLHADDINGVLNDILDAFEYYNAMEEEILSRISSGCTAQELLRIMSEQTGFYLILANAAFLIREAYGRESILEMHHGVKEYISNRMLPVDVLRQINSSPHVRRPNIPPYVMTLSGIGSAVIANLFSRSHHMGWLVICNESCRYTQGEIDLIENLSRLLCIWLDSDREAEEFNEKSSLFVDLLNDTAETEYHYEDRLKAFGWYPQDEKRVYVICPSTQAKIPLSTLSHYLELDSSGQFSFEYEGTLVIVVNHALREVSHFSAHLSALLTSNGYAAGESPVFQSMNRLKKHYEAARLAARYAQDQSVEPDRHPILRFQESIIPYVISLLKEHTAADLRHPALETLKQYDRRHRTSLYETLRVYLEENCSHSAAAKRLFLHRSSLIYRIEKIQILTDIDFSVADERFHLLLSFYIDS